MLTVSQQWRQAYPGASAGVLAMHDVANPRQHAGLERHKTALEAQLRARYAGHDRAAFKALPTMQAYSAYYKQFKKTYHVQLQLESVVLKGKPVPRVAALVETMFMAELDNLLLTAGHDLAVVKPPVAIHVAAGGERYIRLNGQEQELKPGDMYIADSQGILSSVIYGPDRRTQITDRTHKALFTVYAPAGIEPTAVKEHLATIETYVRLIAPEAKTAHLAVYTAEVGE
jgi:DNA/RNA-binding domain of Phe-tRNA-synthetase-like protein